MSAQRNPEKKETLKECLKADDASLFSQLTYLLSLVTTINSEEALPSSFHPNAIIASNDAREEFTLLDSIAAILVQKHEVVAVCYTSDNVSVVAAESESDIPATDVNVDVLVEPSSCFPYKLFPPQFAALCNPEFSTNSGDNNCNLHNVRIETKGENLWAKVQGLSSGWYYAFMGPRPLKDHIATVSAYLNDYKTQTDPKTQADNSGKFTYYLMSTCWQKMLRRITSWQAKGFIYLISNISFENLHKFGQNWEGFPPTPGPGDRSLVDFLNIVRQDDKLIQNVILEHYTDSNASDFSLIFNNVGSACASSHPAPLAVFSRETIPEFHKLTIAAFNGYTSTFTKLQKAYNRLTAAEQTPLEFDPDHPEYDKLTPDRRTAKLTPTQDEVLKLLKNASTHYRFLLYLICSSSFKTYFDVIKESLGSSILPIRGDMKLYIGQVVDAAVEVDGQLEDEAPFEGEANLTSLLRFIKTFVMHLTAKRVLERHSFRTKGQEVDICLLTVNRSNLSIPERSWQNFKTILEESLLPDPRSSNKDDIRIATAIASEAIEILQCKTSSPPEKYSRKSQKLLQNFAKIIQGTRASFSGGLHCETVLVTLSKYFESLMGNDNTNLISTCEKLLQSGMISVSKLCCPVCWELLSILGEEKPFSLRGHHSIIYPIELPKWLPSATVDKMHERFKSHLRKEVEIMVRGIGKGPGADIPRNRHVTHQSESAISVASTNFPVSLAKYK